MRLRLVWVAVLMATLALASCDDDSSPSNNNMPNNINNNTNNNVANNTNSTGNTNNPQACTDGMTRDGETVCGLNDEGVFVQECVDGAWVDTTECTGTDECVNDRTREGSTPCGPNNNGFLMEVCDDGAWVETNTCSSTDECVDGTLQQGTTVCGLNNEGVLMQECIDGAWVDTTDCTGTDECVDGTTREGTTPCGLNNEGFVLEECINGTWQEIWDCSGTDVCVNDSTQIGTASCGLNNEGLEIETCQNGAWVVTDCTGTDECTNGTSQTSTTTCGLNNEGFETETCQSGVWVVTGCTGTDVCVNNDTQIGTTVCGLNNEGFLEQICVNGAWQDTTDCTGTDECVEGTTQNTTTPCGLNNEGVEIETCQNGLWVVTGCTGTDVCANGTTDSTSCGDNLGTQDLLCVNGAWVEDGLCNCNSGYHWDGTTCTQTVDIDWCEVHYPVGYTGAPGVATTIYGQVYGTINGVQATGSGTELPQLRAQVCYDDNGTDVCIDAQYNEFFGPSNDDEYMGDLSIPNAGQYLYWYRFSGDSGTTWTDCDPEIADIVVVSGCDLSNWEIQQQFSNRSFTFPANTLIPAGGTLILARDMDRTEFETFWGVSLPLTTVYLTSGGSFPMMNGDEVYTLFDQNASPIDGPTYAMTKNHIRTRTDTAADPALQTSWTDTGNAPSNASPGAFAGTISNTDGPIISEITDASTYAGEFLEIYCDRR